MPFWRRKKSTLPDFQGPDQRSPEQLIVSFAADYKVWNDYCYTEEVQGGSKSKEMLIRFQEVYDSFLAPYLVQGVRKQLISFGSDSTFDPERMSFTSNEETADGCRVWFTVAHSHLPYEDEYFAELVKGEDDSWKLLEVYYVDPYSEGNPKYLPSL